MRTTPEDARARAVRRDRHEVELDRQRDRPREVGHHHERALEHAHQQQLAAGVVGVDLRRQLGDLGLDLRRRRSGSTRCRRRARGQLLSGRSAVEPCQQEPATVPYGARPARVARPVPGRASRSPAGRARARASTPSDPPGTPAAQRRRAQHPRPYRGRQRRQDLDVEAAARRAQDGGGPARRARRRPGRSCAAVRASASATPGPRAALERGQRRRCGPGPGRRRVVVHRVVPRRQALAPRRRPRWSARRSAEERAAAAGR